MSLPPGFIAIKDAASIRRGERASFIGVIVAIKDQRRTNGADWVSEFTIQDDFSTSTVGGSSSIACRLFQPDPKEFPTISGLGDVAIIRDFKVDIWNSVVLCVTAKHPPSTALVFPKAKIPVPQLSQAYQLGSQQIPSTGLPMTSHATIQEQMAVINLKHASTGFEQQAQQLQRSLTSTIPSTAAPVTPSRGDRQSLIKDLDTNRYYDINAQVVNLYGTNRGTVDLKVTDYTENKDLFLYADPDDPDNWYQDKKWQGPYGQYTLDVCLYGPNSDWARDNVTNGDYIALRNVRIKMSPANKLEGVIHEDRVRPKQVDIRKLMNQIAIDEIKSRRREYEQQRSKKTAFEALQNAPKKASAKIAARKKDKKAKLKLQKEQEQKELEDQAEVWEAERSGVNLNVRAAYPEIQLSTISEIIYNPQLNAQTPERYNDFKLPFVNCRYRARLRVVDFFPPELDLFAHSMADPHWNPKAKSSGAEVEQLKNRWEWGFVLLVEDANIPPNTVSEKLRLMVGNDAAQHLLNLDARDLKTNERVLGQLKEKLFILWGNLLELKTELRDRGSDLPLPPGDNRLQNKPFDCCIEEYGHEVPVTKKNPTGYQRMHRLAATKIQSNTL